MTWREVLQRSVKARITLLTLAVFLVSLGALMWFASRLLREDMQQQISDQQLASVHVIAEQLNQQLIDRFMALQNLSVSIGPKTLASPHALQALLEQQPHVRGLFNFGIFVVAPDGRVLARAPLQQGADAAQGAGADPRAMHQAFRAVLERAQAGLLQSRSGDAGDAGDPRLRGSGGGR